MSDDRDGWKGFVWINAELRVLESKTDPASRERYDEPVDRLITMDMAMGPIRHAMGRRAKKAAGQGEAEKP